RHRRDLRESQFLKPQIALCCNALIGPRGTASLSRRGTVSLRPRQANRKHPGPWGSHNAVISTFLTGGAHDVGRPARRTTQVIRGRGCRGRLVREDIMAIRDRGQGRRAVPPRARAAAPALAIAAIIVAAATAGCGPAAAQGVVRSVYGDWQIRCETPPGAHNEQCALMESVTAEDRPNVGLTVMVLKLADLKSRLMRIVAPLGVILPSGLGLKIDNNDVGRAGFIKCALNGCLAEINMDDNLIAQLRNGQTATFIIFNSPEEGIGFPVSLKGFGPGY